MSLVRGENVAVAEWNEDVSAWVLYGCARTCTLTTSTETIETSVAGSGRDATFKAAKRSFNGSLSGLTNLNGTNLLSLADLRARERAGTPLLIRFFRTANDGVSTYADEGEIIITNVTDEGPYDAMNTFSIEFTGTGPLTQTFDPTEILANVYRFQYTATGGETSFTAVKDIDGNPISLIGKTVLGMEKDGIGLSKMITSGIPANKEFKFVTGTGTLTVPVAFEAGEECFGYYR